MPRSIWNGVISFGMVSIPVKLYTATENKDISFHQLHEACESRIKYQKYCPHCERTVETDEIERGYEFARGQYVILDEDDFESIPLPSKHTIDVSAFVKGEQIDPVYYEKTYYLEPSEAAARPLNLFLRALTDMGMVAVAAVTLRNKERLCCLRPMGGTLVLETLLYPDEVRVNTDDELPRSKITEKELAMAHHLIELMAQDFDPSQYHDHYRDALKKVIDAKLDGKEIAVPEATTPSGKVVDLMEALRVSVENMKAKGRTDPLKQRDKEVSKLMKASAIEDDDDESETDESSDSRSRKSRTKSAEAKTGSKEGTTKKKRTAARSGTAPEAGSARTAKTAEHKRRRKASA